LNFPYQEIYNDIQTHVGFINGRHFWGTQVLRNGTLVKNALFSPRKKHFYTPNSVTPYVKVENLVIMNDVI
jgi:hypothetical protein